MLSFIITLFLLAKPDFFRYKWNFILIVPEVSLSWFNWNTEIKY